MHSAGHSRWLVGADVRTDLLGYVRERLIFVYMVPGLVVWVRAGAIGVESKKIDAHEYSTVH